MVDSVREIERPLNLIHHLVPRHLPPSIRLTPMHPSTTHLERIAADIRRPRATSNTISAFQKEDFQSLSRSIARSGQPAVARTNHDNIVSGVGAGDVRRRIYNTNGRDSHCETGCRCPSESIARRHVVEQRCEAGRRKVSKAQAPQLKTMVLNDSTEKVSHMFLAITRDILCRSSAEFQIAALK